MKSESKTSRAQRLMQEDRALHDWQLEEITKALGEADRRDFASEAEITDAFKKWSK
jgi:hypothetical protein